MDYQEAKRHFITTWGELGINWGINRAMGHIHALLLISPEPICADEIMEDLQISRGNANMNLRALMDWGLAYRSSKPGERKDFFSAEKNFWNVFRKTLDKRRKKELNPMLKMIQEISDVEVNDAYSAEFKKVVDDLDTISSAAHNALNKLIQAESNFFINSFVKVMR